MDSSPSGVLQGSPTDSVDDRGLQLLDVHFSNGTVVPGRRPRRRGPEVSSTYPQGSVVLPWRGRSERPVVHNAGPRPKGPDGERLLLKDKQRTSDKDSRGTISFRDHKKHP